jgi:hypothetical protein
MAWLFGAERKQQEQGLRAIPIVLGIVGHRELREEDRPAIRAALEKVFSEMRAAYRHSPLVVLTSLAEGADQLAAETALASGGYVRAPLPFVPDVFRQSTSFDTEPGRQQFDRLLADARVEWFVAPLPIGTAPADAPWLSVASDKTDPVASALRHTCYANAAGYVVRHCHALVALWDGQPPDPARPSGTAESVAFKLHGRPPASYPFPLRATEPLGYRSDRGPVCVIHTPRADAPARSCAGALDIRVPRDIEPFEWPVSGQPLARRIGARRLLWRLLSSFGLDGMHQRHRSRAARETTATDGHAAELRQFQQICQSVDDFNRDIQTQPGSAEVEVQSRAVPTRCAEADPFDDQHRRWFERLSAVREAAAFLSRRLQTRLDRVMVLLFLLLGCSAAAFHLYVHWIHTSEVGRHAVRAPRLLELSIVFLSAAVLLTLFVRWRRCEERRLDYRALAEALRVRRQWALAGIGASVADAYLGQMRNEMTWVRHALRHVCPPPEQWASRFERLPSSQRLKLLTVVRNDWVQGQADYYETSHAREHRAATRLRRLGLGFAASGWVLLFMLVVPWPVTATHPPGWMLIMAPLLITISGLCIAYNDRRSHEELSNQYERLRVLFGNGLTELDLHLRDGDVAGAQQVLRALGQEALAEHAQWLILRRARPMELHLGG